MNKMKSLIVGILFTILAISPVVAKECHTVYGGGEVCDSCNISVDKEIMNPDEDEYWDNIDSSDYTFSAGEEVKFKIVIKNTSEVTIKGIKVRDYLPDYVEFVSTDVDENGYEYKEDDNELVYGLDDLSEDESETIYLTVRVKGEGDIPTGITTLTNKARGYSGDECSDTDYANFAIEREGKGTVLGTTSPETGTNNLILTLEMIGFLGMAGAYGIVLKKRK